MTTSQKWPSNLVIVRHAQSQRNLWKEIATNKGDFVYDGKFRDMDVPLTPLGEQQATATGQHLARELKFDRVYASPFVRTMETARFITAGFPYKVEIVEDERLREIDFGLLDGLTKHGIAHFHKDEVARKKKLKKYWYRAPAGENWPDVGLRVHSFFDTVAREMAGESVLVVCHSVVVLIFCKLLDRLSEHQILELDDREDVKNCGIVHYVFDPSQGANGKLVRRMYNQVFYDGKPGDAK